jgi:hypothetical protein
LDLSEQKEIILKAELNNFDRKQFILDELINFIKEENIICPLPDIWQRFYRFLVSRNMEPPLPFVLTAWHHTTDEEKRERFIDQINVANRNGKLRTIKDFIRKLKTEDFYYAGTY